MQHAFIRVCVHHGRPDGDGGLAVGRGRGAPILLVPGHAGPGTEAAADAAGRLRLLVGAAWVEAVLTRARFPHVFSKLAARRHFNGNLNVPLAQDCLWVTVGRSRWNRDGGLWTSCTLHRRRNLRRKGQNRTVRGRRARPSQRTLNWTGPHHSGNKLHPESAPEQGNSGC